MRGNMSMNVALRMVLVVHLGFCLGPCQRHHGVVARRRSRVLQGRGRLGRNGCSSFSSYGIAAHVARGGRAAVSLMFLLLVFFPLLLLLFSLLVAKQTLEETDLLGGRRGPGIIRTMMVMVMVMAKSSVSVSVGVGSGVDARARHRDLYHGLGPSSAGGDVRGGRGRGNSDVLVVHQSGRRHGVAADPIVRGENAARGVYRRVEDGRPSSVHLDVGGHAFSLGLGPLAPDGGGVGSDQPADIDGGNSVLLKQLLRVLGIHGAKMWSCVVYLRVYICAYACMSM